MDCCSSSAGTVGRCPACGRPGLRVTTRTVRALARPPVEIVDGDWRYCGGPDCPVLWYAEGRRIERTACAVPAWPKERDPDSLVCACFGYTVGQVRAARQEDGGNAVFQAIAARCRRGEDRCEETSPLGSCCLGRVREVAAQGGGEREPPAGAG